jgi:hypothetical protein
MSIEPLSGAGPGAIAVEARKPQPNLAQSVTEAAIEASPQTSRPVDAPAPHLIEPSLIIELDQSAQRFVQTLVDPATGAVLRRYPDEIQLTFSRGVAAYVKAQRGA